MAREKLNDVPGGDNSLHTKYRPKTLKAMVGQRELVESLTKALALTSRPHSYLFWGPAGCGKTTLARIVATELSITPDNLIEVDAATNTGIDALRAVTDTLKYKGFGDSVLKMVIIDEVHALSKPAMTSLLKILEEPPAHVYFALCTTDPGRVPDTIQTRCARYTVKELLKNDMFDLVTLVCRKEGYDIPESVVDQVVKVSNGSVRRALTGLALVSDCQNPKEAALLLAQPFETEDVIELCRALISKSGPTWAQVVGVLNGVKDDDPESLRLIVVNYLNAVILGSDDKRAPALLDILSYFTRSTALNRSEKMAPLLLAFGRVIFKD